MISKRSIFGSASLALLVLLTSYVAAINSRIEPEGHTASQVMATAQDVTLLQMDAMGLPEYQAHIASASQLGNGNTLFHTIKATIFSHGQNAPWYLSANEGKSMDDNNKIRVFGQVQALRPASAHNAPFRFQTSTLTLFPPTDTATTKAKVILSEPGSQNVTTGVGMHAQLKPQRIIHILSDVKSTYETAKTSHIPVQS